MNSNSPLSEANLPSTIHQLRAEVTFNKIKELFAGKNIELILLKGPHLGYTIYDSPQERPYSDLDILVKPEDFKLGATQLLEKGFKPFAYDTFAPEIQRDFKHWEFISPWGVLVELHRWLSGHDRYPVESAGLFERAEKFHFGETAALGLSTEDLLLHLCLHMGTSYFHVIEGKHVADIGLLIKKREVNWPVFQQRAKKTGARAIVYYALTAAMMQKDAPVPMGVMNKLRPGKLRRFWLEKNLDPSAFPIYCFPEHSLKKIKRRLLLPLLDRPGQWFWFFRRMATAKLRWMHKVIKGNR
jgi:hypothetical protein